MPVKNKYRIGIFIDWVYSEYHQKILSGIMDYFDGLPADIFCFPTGRYKSKDNWERKKNILFEYVDESNTDGLIVLTDPLQCDVGKSKFLRFLKRYGKIPIVSISVQLDEHYSVLIDNKSGMEAILDHLIIKHHFERIAFITGPEGYHESEERLETFLNYFKTHNLPVDSNLIIQGGFTGLSGRQAVKTLLDEKKVSFDCIMAGNDEMAIGAIEELTSRGLQVPGDLYVTGFDDINASGRASLTTVRQPIYELGRKSSEILYGVLTGKKPERLHKLPTTLVIRETCGCRLQRLLNTAVWKKGLTEPAEDFEENFTLAREKIINEIISGWPVEKYFELKSELFPWLDTLCSELVEAYRTNEVKKIIDAWGRIIFQSYSKNMDLIFLNEIVSGFRRIILRCRLDYTKIIFFEDIFHRMRIMAEEVDHKELVYRETLSILEFGRFSSVSATLSDSTDLEGLIPLIYNVLNRLEMKTCFLSLFRDPEKPLESSRLILALSDKKRPDLSNIKPDFKTKDLLPNKIYPHDGQNRFIVQALNENIGTVILDLKDYIGNVTIYDELDLKVSSTIRLIMLIDKISRQALSLGEEIKERKKAEKKVKTAMSKLEKYNEILHDLSLKDDLTGLYNRRGFLTLGGQQLNYSRRFNKCFVLFYFDMDGLKKINDTYGHEEGDFAIKKTALLLQKSFRSIDIIARIGGDEFTVFAADCCTEEAEKLKKRVKILFQNFNNLSGKGYRLSISAGIVPVDGSSRLKFNELMALADRKLYEDKHKDG